MRGRGEQRSLIQIDRRWSHPMSTAVHITWHGAQINFGDLPTSIFNLCLRQEDCIARQGSSCGNKWNEMRWWLSDVSKLGPWHQHTQYSYYLILVQHRNMKNRWYLVDCSEAESKEKHGVWEWDQCRSWLWPHLMFIVRSKVDSNTFTGQFYVDLNLMPEYTTTLCRSRL
jgi:hypothetical protein